VTARRSFLLAASFLAAMAVVPGLAATADVPADFIRALANQALGIIGGGLMIQQKLEFFRALLRQDFDLDGIARFTLGRYWRIATEAERQEFRRLLEDYLLITYGQRLQQIGAGGGTLRVTGSRVLPDGAIVTSEIVRPGGPPIKVDWRLGVHGGLWKIDDVSIDGVSMAISQRAEFGTAIQRGGGAIGGLLAMLREAIAPAQMVLPTSVEEGVGKDKP
jgi:phospholipid transport system substrate-binding protein